MMLITPLNSYAALQSNPSTHYDYRKNVSEWMREIRYMEASNNAMGLTEQFNSDLTTKDGTDSNNIDVHMMRNTEYGAIAILAVSGYGNPSTIYASSLKTTTGNVTGVYYTSTAGEWNAKYTEVVAGGGTAAVNGVNSRYYDTYSTTPGNVKVGDALDLKWQGASSTSWIDNTTHFFSRNAYGYFGYGPYAENKGTICSRGVAVCGTGL